MGHVVVLKFQPVLQAAVCLQDRVEILLSKSQRLKVRRFDRDDEFGKGFGKDTTLEFNMDTKRCHI